MTTQMEYIVGDVIELRMRWLESGVGADPTQTITITNEATGAVMATIVNASIARETDGWMKATYTTTVEGSFDLCWEAVNPNKTINAVFIVRKKAK